MSATLRDSTNGESVQAVHALSVDTVVAKVRTTPETGLTAAEAEARLRDGGPNELPDPPGRSAILRFLDQFANPIVLTLLVAAIVAVVHGASETHGEPFLLRYGDAIAIGLIVVLNAVLGFYQEQKAEAALDALKRMQSTNARVRRGSVIRVVPAREVVVGDVLELEAGDAVPADARLLQAINVASEESSLTGESVPVGKDAIAVVAEDATLGDRSNMLFVGSSVIRGKAVAVVVATAANTELGKLSTLIRDADDDRSTPLEDKLDSFGKKILWVCLGLSGVLFVRGMMSGNRSWSELLLEAVSLAVAAIPEGLPAITTITLALGTQRMAERGAIIRKLAAVETLGSATVICTDKTGTLTQNEMTVREVVTDGVAYSVTGSGYDPHGEIKNPAGEAVLVPGRALRNLLATVALCNNATLESGPDGATKVVGDPTEGALLTLAAKGGLPRESLAPSHQFLQEVPFDSDRKRMTVVTLDERGREVAHTKGSADVLLPLCANVATDAGDRPMRDDDRAAILAALERMGDRALRVLGVARRTLRERKAESGTEPPSLELEQELTFLGLVGMIDPPRDGVKEAIHAAADASVRTIMITGDHKLTAVAIAKELGLWEAGASAITGSELEAMDAATLRERVESARVFARVTAEQKLLIVRAFKERGHVVAMTGDGVNDAPALREAHIGVAMGRSGTDVAREAADMVIADDNFATIVDAVREGRAVYRNIQKFIFFLLSSNAGLLFAVFVAAFVPRFSPLTPLMILWINLVTNGLPALALGIDPPDASQMNEPPRRANEGLLGTRDGLGIAFVGLVMGAIAMSFYVAPPPGDPSIEGDARGRALAFSLLALSPLFHAMNCRSQTASAFQAKPLFPLPLVLAVALSAGIHLVAVLVPSLRPIFRTFPLGRTEWLVLLVASAAIVPAVEIVKAGSRMLRRA
ncbi:MAG: cation-translocating P-type ATPase [Polyangiaceae bacterium]